MQYLLIFLGQINKSDINGLKALHIFKVKLPLVPCFGFRRLKYVPD